MANSRKTKEVAEFGYKAMMKGKLIAVHGFKNKELAFLSHHAPKNMVIKTARKLNETKA